MVNGRHDRQRRTSRDGLQTDPTAHAQVRHVDVAAVHVHGPAGARHVDRPGVVSAGDADRAEPALGVLGRVDVQVRAERAFEDLDQAHLRHVDPAAGPRGG